MKLGLGTKRIFLRPPRFSHSRRCDCSVIIARLANADAYWAAIASTLAAMQSTLGDAVALDERIVASAAGASVGAIEANHLRVNLFVFAFAIFFSDAHFVLFGEGRISLREHHTDDHRSYSVLGSDMGDGFASIH